jgi:hypothetical protein
VSVGHGRGDIIASLPHHCGHHPQSVGHLSSSSVVLGWESVGRVGRRGDIIASSPWSLSAVRSPQSVGRLSSSSAVLGGGRSCRS